MEILPHHRPLEQLHRLARLPHTHTVGDTRGRRRRPASPPPFLIPIRPSQQCQSQPSFSGGARKQRAPSQSGTTSPPQQSTRLHSSPHAPQLSIKPKLPKIHPQPPPLLLATLNRPQLPIQPLDLRPRLLQLVHPLPADLVAQHGVARGVVRARQAQQVAVLVGPVHDHLDLDGRVGGGPVAAAEGVEVGWEGDDDGAAVGEDCGVVLGVGVFCFVFLFWGFLGEW